MTPSCEAEKEDQRYFNSPPHKKNHIATTMINTVFFKISTHILTKRMTIIHSFAAPAIYISTHILTKRMTTLHQLVRLSERYFNSHPHEEDDPDAAWQSATYCYFNSHPHEEDDLRSQGFLSEAYIISTHILTKRMTEQMLNGLFYLDISTHILTKRMTIIHSFAAPAIYISTHILTKRMTDGFPTFCILCVISTHILTKRMTKETVSPREVKKFQLTSSRRG